MNRRVGTANALNFAFQSGYQNLVSIEFVRSLNRLGNMKVMFFSFLAFYHIILDIQKTTCHRERDRDWDRIVFSRTTVKYNRLICLNPFYVIILLSS